MKEMVLHGDNTNIVSLLHLDLIESVEDTSDHSMSRARVTFKNGYALSIIRGEYSFGGSEGLFEIAIMDKSGRMTGAFFDKEDCGDTVLGHCDIDKVRRYIEKVGNI